MMNGSKQQRLLLLLLSHATSSSFCSCNSGGGGLHTPPPSLACILPARGAAPVRSNRSLAARVRQPLRSRCLAALTLPLHWLLLFKVEPPPLLPQLLPCARSCCCCCRYAIVYAAAGSTPNTSKSCQTARNCHWQAWATRTQRAGGPSASSGATLCRRGWSGLKRCVGWTATVMG